MDKAYGFDRSTWEAARSEMRDILVKRAASKVNQTIAYSELTAQMRTIRLEPQGEPLAYMLGEISTAEAQDGRGMLSVIVVRKYGDMKPGPGFFELAAKLGRDVSDADKFWISEFNLVTSYWKRHFAA